MYPLNLKYVPFIFPYWKQGLDLKYVFLGLEYVPLGFKCASLNLKYVFSLGLKYVPLRLQICFNSEICIFRYRICAFRFQICIS